jgi:hypothetical protein
MTRHFHLPHGKLRLPALPARRPRFIAERAALGAGAIGALALGAFAVGALAIGALAVNRLAVKRARIERLAIGTLAVDRLVVRERFEAPEHPGESAG